MIISTRYHFGKNTLTGEHARTLCLCVCVCAVCLFPSCLHYSAPMVSNTLPTHAHSRITQRGSNDSYFMNIFLSQHCEKQMRHTHAHKQTHTLSLAPEKNLNTAQKLLNKSSLSLCSFIKSKE